MAWTVPMTATANQIFTASDFNLYVRDNLNETMAGKATTASGYFVADQENLGSLHERQLSSHTVATTQTRTSTSYGDLATVGPTLTVTTGTTAMVWFTSRSFNSGSSAGSLSSVAVSGGSYVPASDNWAHRTDGAPAAGSDAVRCMGFNWFHNLNPGSNTFTMKYRVISGTGSFENRTMIVMPLS